MTRMPVYRDAVGDIDEHAPNPPIHASHLARKPPRRIRKPACRLSAKCRICCREVQFGPLPGGAQWRRLSMFGGGTFGILLLYAFTTDFGIEVRTDRPEQPSRHERAYHR